MMKYPGITEQEWGLMGMTPEMAAASNMTGDQVKALLTVKRTANVAGAAALDNQKVEMTVKDLKEFRSLMEEVKSIKQQNLDGILGDDEAKTRLTEMFKGVIQEQMNAYQVKQAAKIQFPSSVLNTSQIVDTLKAASTLPKGKARNDAATLAMTFFTQNEELKALQDAADDFQVMDAAMRAWDSEYRKNGNPRELKAWKKFEAMRNDVFKAIAPMDVSDQSEWVPTGLSSQVLDIPMVIGQMEPLFQHIYMPTNPYHFPLNLNGADVLPTKVAEVGTIVNPWDDTAGQEITSGAMVFTAFKTRSRMVTSGELTEDAIVPLIPMIKTELRKVQDNGTEAIILNGDTTSTHMDTDTHALGATDCRKCAKGLRHYLLNAGSSDLVVDFGATFAVASMRAIRGKAQKYGVRPSEGAWIAGIKTYVGKLLALDDVRTLDKYGPQATVLTGELAKFDGVPVIISEHQREDVDETGVNGADENTHATLMYINHRYFFVGDRRLMTVEAERLVNTDQFNLVSFRRYAFMPLQTPSATYRFGGIGIELTV